MLPVLATLSSFSSVELTQASRFVVAGSFVAVTPFLADCAFGLTDALACTLGIVFVPSGWAMIVGPDFALALISVGSSTRFFPPVKREIKSLQTFLRALRILVADDSSAGEFSSAARYFAIQASSCWLFE
jgi:hypothetical protein